MVAAGNHCPGQFALPCPFCFPDPQLSQGLARSVVFQAGSQQHAAVFLFAGACVMRTWSQNPTSKDESRESQNLLGPTLSFSHWQGVAIPSLTCRKCWSLRPVNCQTLNRRAQSATHNGSRPLGLSRTLAAAGLLKKTHLPSQARRPAKHAGSVSGVLHPQLPLYTFPQNADKLPRTVMMPRTVTQTHTKKRLRDTETRDFGRTGLGS